MKFGKRLDAEASRCWRSFYFDYKQVKQSIKQDAQMPGASGLHGGLLESPTNLRMREEEAFVDSVGPLEITSLCSGRGYVVATLGPLRAFSQWACAPLSLAPSH